MERQKVNTVCFKTRILYVYVVWFWFNDGEILRTHASSFSRVNRLRFGPFPISTSPSHRWEQRWELCMIMSVLVLLLYAIVSSLVETWLCSVFAPGHNRTSTEENNCLERMDRIGAWSEISQYVKLMSFRAAGKHRNRQVLQTGPSFCIWLSALSMGSVAQCFLCSFSGTILFCKTEIKWGLIPRWEHWPNDGNDK